MPTDERSRSKPTDERGTGVLVVDDHPLVREGLKKIIGSQSELRVVAEASDLASARRAAADASVGLVVVDISLGRDNGLDLVRELHVGKPHLPVIVVSMHDETVFAERALRLGARAYVMKSEPPDVLLAAIRRVLEGEIHVSPRVARDVLRGLRPRDDVPSKSGMSALSDREREVFGLIGRGMSTREIAHALHVSVKTVESHKANIKTKLGVDSATKLVVYAVQWALHGDPPSRGDLGAGGAHGHPPPKRRGDRPRLQRSKRRRHRA